jgi:hypothetical protein
MGNRFRARAVIAALLGVVAVAAIGVMSYNAGFAQGLTEGGRIAGTPGGAPPYVYMWRPWGFGFGFFPLFFIVLWFFVLRGLFWRGRRGPWGWHDDGVPPRFEEWHRRAHEQERSVQPTTGTTA